MEELLIRHEDAVEGGGGVIIPTPCTHEHLTHLAPRCSYDHHLTALQLCVTSTVQQFQNLSRNSICFCWYGDAGHFPVRHGLYAECSKTPGQALQLEPASAVWFSTCRLVKLRQQQTLQQPPVHKDVHSFTQHTSLENHQASIHRILRADDHLSKHDHWEESSKLLCSIRTMTIKKGDRTARLRVMTFWIQRSMGPSFTCKMNVLNSVTATHASSNGKLSPRLCNTRPAGLQHCCQVPTSSESQTGRMLNDRAKKLAISSTSFCHSLASVSAIQDDSDAFC